MTLLIAAPGDTTQWTDAFRAADPRQPVVVWPDVPDPAAVRWAAVWKPPAGLFAELPNLKAVFSLGAGVDSLVGRPDLPDLPLVRIVDGGMAAQMAEVALYGVLHVHRQFDLLRAQQTAALWRDLGACEPAALRVGILGLGALGGGVIERLRPFGFALKGWSRSPKQVEGVDTFHGEGALDSFLSQVDVLIVLVPLTDETRGLLSRERLAVLPDGASIINLARGALIDEAALLDGLDEGRLRFALLDVFAVEPLPAAHRFWRHPRVLVTPHSAAATLRRPAAAQIVEGIAAFRAGRVPEGLVDRSRGY